MVPAGGGEALRRRLEQYLAVSQRPPARPAPVPPLRSFRLGVPSFRRGVPRAGTCYVAGDGCSLIPCVEFARITTATAVVHGGPATAGSSCRGRLGAPKILRVAEP